MTVKNNFKWFFVLILLVLSAGLVSAGIPTIIDMNFNDGSWDAYLGQPVFGHDCFVLRANTSFIDFYNNSGETVVRLRDAGASDGLTGCNISNVDASGETHQVFFEIEKASGTFASTSNNFIGLRNTGNQYTLGIGGNGNNGYYWSNNVLTNVFNSTWWSTNEVSNFTFNVDQSGDTNNNLTISKPTQTDFTTFDNRGSGGTRVYNELILDADKDMNTGVLYIKRICVAETLANCTNVFGSDAGEFNVTLLSPENGNVTSSVNNTLSFNLTGDWNNSVNVSCDLLIDSTVNMSKTIVGAVGVGSRIAKPDDTVGLRAMYHFDESDTDTVLVDSGPASKNMTGLNIGSGDWIAGQFNNTCDLDGVDEAFEQSDATDNYFLEQDFVAIDFWANSNEDYDVTSVEQVVFNARDSDGGGSGGWHVRFNAGADTIFFSVVDTVGGVHNSFANKTDWDANTWYHFYIEWNGTRTKFIIDGVEHGEENFTHDMDNTLDVGTAVAVGYFSEDNQDLFWFNGSLDDMGIYNVSLLDNNVMTCSDPTTLGSGTTGWCYNESVVTTWSNPHNFSFYYPVYENNPTLVEWEVNCTQDANNGISEQWNYSIDTRVINTPSETSLTRGTLTTGNVVSMRVDDNDFYNVTEQTGINGFNLSLNFTLWSEFNQIRLIYSRDDPATQEMDVLLQNTTGDWIIIAEINETVGFEERNLSVADWTLYNNSGIINMRLDHPDAGNINHMIDIDLIILENITLPSGDGNVSNVNVSSPDCTVSAETVVAYTFDCVGSANCTGNYNISNPSSCTLFSGTLDNTYNILNSSSFEVNISWTCSVATDYDFGWNVTNTGDSAVEGSSTVTCSAGGGGLTPDESEALLNIEEAIVMLWIVILFLGLLIVGLWKSLGILVSGAGIVAMFVAREFYNANDIFLGVGLFVVGLLLFFYGFIIAKKMMGE